jgi:hypothetical protein
VRTAGLDIAADNFLSERSNRSLSLCGLWHAVWRGGPGARNIQAVWGSIESGHDPHDADANPQHYFHAEIVLCLWTVACEARNTRAIQYLVHQTPRYLIREALQLAVHFKWAIACMALAAYATRCSVQPVTNELTEPLWCANHVDFLSGVVGSMLDLPCIFEGLLSSHLQLARATRSGPVWQALQSRARKRLSSVAACALAVIAWKRWTAYMCHPDSRYVARKAVAWGQNK